MIGHQLNIDLKGCNSLLLEEVPFIESVIQNIVAHLKLNVITVTSHKFEPGGITSIAIISSSHISIHTWPEFAFASVDIFICDTIKNENEVVHLVAAMFESTNSRIFSLDRGVGVS